MSEDVIASGRVAVVTGAGSGIGAGTARALARRGMRVVVADIDPVRAESVAVQLRDSGARSMAVEVDVADYESVAALADRVFEEWSTVNLLVNNAGIETTGLVWELSPQRWRTMMSVNVDGVFHGIRAFTPRLIAGGEPAHIVNVASIGALAAVPHQIPYIVSKHAVLALTESLWEEFRAENVTVGVSALLPGPVATDIFAAAESSDIDGPGAAHMRQMLDLLEEQGADPTEIGDILADGVVAGELWIHTHPEISKGSLQRRTARLQAAIERQDGLRQRLDAER